MLVPLPEGYGWRVSTDVLLEDDVNRDSSGIELPAKGIEEAEIFS